MLLHTSADWTSAAPTLVSFLSVTSPMLSLRSSTVFSTSTPVGNSSSLRRPTRGWKLADVSSSWVPSLARLRVFPSTLSILALRVPSRPSPGAWLSVSYFFTVIMGSYLTNHRRWREEGYSQLRCSRWHQDRYVSRCLPGVHSWR